MASYNPKDIYQMGITEKSDEDQFRAMNDEVVIVGKNIDVIREYAFKIKTTLSNLEVRLDLEEFENLIADLKSVLRMISKTIDFQRRYNSERDVSKRNKLLSTRLSENDPPVPAAFRKSAAAEHLDTLCPLTVFLKAVSISLTTLNIGSMSGGMGTAQAIIGLLQAMSAQLTKKGPSDKQCRGLANCIIIHEKNSRFLVFGTAPYYKNLRGLQNAAWETREKYLKTLQGKLPEAAKLQVKAAEVLSRQIWEEAMAGKTPTQAPEGYNQLVITGTNVSVTPRGQYKSACLTDWLRMVIDRPEAARKAEDMMPVDQRRAQKQITSCAEWVLVNYLFYDPDPAKPPTQGKPSAGSHKKSDSWPKSDEKAKTSVAAAKAPEPLPKELGQAKVGKGRAASPPGSSSTNNMKVVDRTKKTKK